MKNIFVYLFDEFSDWEISYLTPQIHKSDDFNLVYFSDTSNKVTSMGGLEINTINNLNTINKEAVDMLILPGGTYWETNKNPKLLELLRALNKSNKPIGAICAATSFLANHGFLDSKDHTSNDLSYLKSITTNYKGDSFYKNQSAVTGENIITASGIAPIEFAAEIFKKINLFPPEQIENWYQLFKNGIWKG